MSSKADLARTVDPAEWEKLRAWLVRHADQLRSDGELLDQLGLKPATSNVVEFIPPTLARLEAERKREAEAREAIEAVAEANFRTQAQIQAAVLDLLDSRSHTDLARRVEESAQRHFDLVTATLALEGPDRVPVGWKLLTPGCVDELLGAGRAARLGSIAGLEPLFGDRARQVKSVALIRMSLWRPERSALMAYGSSDASHFAPGMGLELVNYLARVVERTTERWPVL